METLGSDFRIDLENPYARKLLSDAANEQATRGRSLLDDVWQSGQRKFEEQKEMLRRALDGPEGRRELRDAFSTRYREIKDSIEAPLLHGTPRGASRGAADFTVEAWKAIVYEKLGRSLLRLRFSARPRMGGSATPGGGPGVVTQLTPNSCGPSCGKMLLGDRGIGATRTQIARRSGVLTSPDSLAAGLNAVDDVGRWMGGGVDLASFGALNETGSWGAMLWTRGMKTGHWVVVDGVSAGKVLLRDPAVGRVAMGVDEFMEKWGGFAVWRQ